MSTARWRSPDVDGGRAEIADGLARLTDHHLLVVAAGEPTRYRALETIRQFAAEQLTELGQFDGALERHRRWCHEQLSALAQQERDEAWCERFDRVAAEVRASIMSAVEHQLDSVAGDLAERLAEQLFLRGQPAEAQHRYEQAADLSPTGLDRVRLLRLAAGAAAARIVGNDTLRLLDTAATEAVFRRGARGRRRRPGLDGDLHPQLSRHHRRRARRRRVRVVAR